MKPLAAGYAPVAGHMQTTMSAHDAPAALLLLLGRKQSRLPAGSGATLKTKN
jgi:hypothetical protein